MAGWHEPAPPLKLEFHNAMRPADMPTLDSSPRVSVVTPFHNTAAHLRECIASVLAQTCEDFEYVLQDNASTDGSTEIALEYAQRDPRIRYLRIDELQTQVRNYNLALTRIDPASTYCKIVQADDWITPECLQRMTAIAAQSPRIGLVAAYRFKGPNIEGDGLPPATTMLPGAEAARFHLLTQNFLFGSPTTVLYRSDAVRRRAPFFTEGRLNDDTEACYELLRDWDFGFVHQILSYTRLDEQSISGRLSDKDPGILDRLLNIRRYGPEFLSAEEFQRRATEMERRYYRRLARAALTLREPAYWQFHRQGLLTQGPGLEWGKLLRAMGREVLSIAACPQELVGIIRAWGRALTR
jgi:glycosyltransferase involved in cell wall biosynthesis